MTAATGPDLLTDISELYCWGDRPEGFGASFVGDDVFRALTTASPLFPAEDYPHRRLPYLMYLLVIQSSARQSLARTTAAMMPMWLHDARC